MAKYNLKLVDFKVEGTLTVDDRVAEVLEWICGYSLLDWFATQCSTKYKPEYLKEVLSDLRTECARIVEARNEALKSLNTNTPKPKS